MNENTKIEVASEIMNAMIARQCKNGYNKNNNALQTLLKEEQEMSKFNYKVINKIIDVYGPMVRGGKQNG